MDIATVHDIAEVERIIGHSTVFHSSCDDGTAGLSEFDVAFWWLTTPGNIVFKQKDSLIMLQPRNSITYEMHIGVVDGARREAFSFAGEVARWLLANTDCRKIVAMIPVFHRASILYAKLCGMSQEGISKDSFLRGGELYDCVLLGATKEQLILKHGGGVCHQ